MIWEFEVNPKRNKDFGSKKYQFLEKVQGGGGGIILKIFLQEY
jgi:hypothetical protein